LSRLYRGKMRKIEENCGIRKTLIFRAL